MTYSYIAQKLAKSQSACRLPSRCEHLFADKAFHVATSLQNVDGVYFNSTCINVVKAPMKKFKRDYHKTWNFGPTIATGSVYLLAMAAVDA